MQKKKYIFLKLHCWNEKLIFLYWLEILELSHLFVCEDVQDFLFFHLCESD